MAKAKVKEDGFNWKGIRDNNDGSFEVTDKFAKNRLMKEFRKQGIRARSTKTGEKGYYVYPIGARKPRARGMGRMPRKELQRYPRYKPRTRVQTLGPRPQIRPTGPGAPIFGGGGFHPGAGHPGKKGGFSEAIRKGMAARAQRTRDLQRSPYTSEGKPRPGYQTYYDRRTGVQRIVRMPEGGFKDRFMGRERREMVHQARVKESYDIEKDLRQRSAGQPSTRIAPSAPTRENPYSQQELQQRRTERIERPDEHKV